MFYLKSFSSYISDSTRDGTILTTEHQQGVPTYKARHGEEDPMTRCNAALGFETAQEAADYLKQLLDTRERRGIFNHSDWKVIEEEPLEITPCGVEKTASERILVKEICPLSDSEARDLLCYLVGYLGDHHSPTVRKAFATAVKSARKSAVKPLTTA